LPIHAANGTLELTSALELGDSPLVLPVLLILSAVPLGIGIGLGSRHQRLNDAITRTAHVQRWQLEQMVPRA
jgi:hypothetical protein